MSDTLVFVYNADSGLFNTLTDTAHKLFSPETYECNLCAMTFSALGMKKEWKEFLDTMDIPLEFLHRDELKEKYGTETDLPAIFLKSEKELNLIIEASSSNECRNIEELKQLVIVVHGNIKIKLHVYLLQLFRQLMDKAVALCNFVARITQHLKLQILFLLHSKVVLHLLRRNSHQRSAESTNLGCGFL